MLEQLDPHSQFLDGLEYEDLMVSTRGEFGGLGILISYRDDYPTVISPIEGTPGARAGLRGGDQIVEIEGMDTKGWRTQKAVKYLRGKPREVINVHSVPFHGMFDDGIGYVKIANFSRSTPEELRDALRDLESNGMRALVIDLRNNPGGLLQAAKQVSELFLEKDRLIVYTKGRMPNSSRKYYSSNRRAHGGYPIVVMINGASASASEIFAGAMQDWDHALIVGERSFGKGTVQTVFDLSDSEAVKLTTARYYTPSGRSIHRKRPRRGEHAAADTASTDDATSRPVFHTAAGRTVYGGGGIAPDYELDPPRYTDLQRRLERDALGFSFVVEYLQDHEITRDFQVTDDVLDAFYAFLERRGFEYDADELTDENVNYIRMMIQREAMNNRFGREAMYRVVLAGDPEFSEVRKLLENARSLEDLFAMAEEQRAVQKASND